VTSDGHTFHGITLIHLLIDKGLTLILCGVLLAGSLWFGFTRFALYTFNVFFDFLEACWYFLLSLYIRVRQVNELLRNYVIVNCGRHLVVANRSSLICRY
jgi:hypothetical protein